MMQQANASHTESRLQQKDSTMESKLRINIMAGGANTLYGAVHLQLACIEVGFGGHLSITYPGDSHFLDQTTLPSQQRATLPA